MAESREAAPCAPSLGSQVAPSCLAPGPVQSPAALVWSGKYLASRSLLLLLMTLSWAHCLHFTAARLRLPACGISSRSRSRRAVGSLNTSPCSGHGARYPGNPFTLLAPTPGAARAGQVPQPSMCPPQPIPITLPSLLPQRPSPHHLQLNPLLSLAHGPLQGLQQLL